MSLSALRHITGMCLHVSREQLLGISLPHNICGDCYYLSEKCKDKCVIFKNSAFK